MCRRIKERERGKRPPAWLREEGLGWIVGAHLRLRKRKVAGEPVANKRQLYELWVEQQGKCGLTGLPFQGVPHLDHKVPVSAGGGHTVDNLHWTSPMANHAKNDKTVAEFEQWLLAAADSLRAKKQLEALL